MFLIPISCENKPSSSLPLERQQNYTVLKTGNWDTLKKCDGHNQNQNQKYVINPQGEIRKSSFFKDLFWATYVFIHQWGWELKRNLCAKKWGLTYRKRATRGFFSQAICTDDKDLHPVST